MLEPNHLISFYLYLYINIIHYFLHYVKRFVLYFCKSFYIGFQSVPAYRSSFFPFSNLSARILLGTLWFTWLHRAFRCQLRRVCSHHQDLIFYFYYLYNYYTSFLAVCQEKCSLILKKFLSSPAPINWATNYFLLSHFAAVSVISCEASW